MLLLCFGIRLSGHVYTRLADCDTLDQAAADGGDMSALVWGSREKLNTRLFSYRRQERLWWKFPNDRQLMVLTQEEVRIKTQILVGAEATHKEFTDTMVSKYWQLWAHQPKEVLRNMKSTPHKEMMYPFTQTLITDEK